MIDAQLRALLDQSRDALGPDRAAIARVRHAVGMKVGVAAAPVAIKAIAIKLAAVVVVGGSVAAVAVERSHRMVATAPEIQLAPEHEVVDQPTPVHIEAPIHEAAPPPARVVTRVAPQALPPPAPTPITLSRETELVDAATRAMRAAKLDEVRSIIATYQREAAGAGQLAKEISAIEIEALCRAANPDALTKLAAFDARWPRAGQRSRLTAACKGLP